MSREITAARSRISPLQPSAPSGFDVFLDALLGKPLTVPLVSVDEAALGSTLMERVYKAAGRSTTTGLA